GRARMAHVARPDAERADLAQRGELVACERALEIAHADREEWRRKVPRQTRSERHRRARRTPDVDLQIGASERREETEALDVIHVQVREQHVDAALCRRDDLSQAPDPRAGIEDEEVIAIADLDARSVAAEAHGVGPRGSEGAARA